MSAVYLLVTAPAKLVNEAQSPEITGELTEWLERNERGISAHRALIPGTEKRIRWFQDRKDSRTPYSLVYLHGFSATRQEIAPVGEQLADALGANLFETRLAGHGLQQHALQGVRAEDWLDDAAEALAVGAAIGDRIILMGTSNGATLAMAMAGHPAFAQVSTIILMSPNFGPKDASAEFLTWPGGPQLAYFVVGETRTWTAFNDLQARYWSTTYPMSAVVEMMRLVDYVRTRLPLRLEQDLLVFYSPADTVVETGRTVAAYGEINSPHKQLVVIPSSSDPSNHVIAGNIMSPENNSAVVEAIIQFVTSR
ncbi:MAG: alpha/beta fold hydrolase [Xanthomonadales bacterium]|nr:alpha/beta fold hydrolase [Xanthomonadales bacterium]